MDNTELSLTDLQNENSTEISKAAVEESLLYTGRYTAIVQKVDIYQTSREDEINPDRRMARIFAVMEQDGERKGTASVRVSWQLRSTPSGRLDGPSRKYDQLRRALGYSPNTAVSEILEAVRDGAMFDVMIEEMYKVDVDDLHFSHDGHEPGADGQVWLTLKPGEREIRDFYIDRGYEPLTVVKRIQRCV